MEIQYKVCGAEDLETLLAPRLALLREANGYAPDTYMGDVEENNRLFLQENMSGENHMAYLACREGQVVGCGGLCFYTLMPTCQGPNGRCAHVMNIYTLPQYRRQGVGRGILRHLLAKAKAEGCARILLGASDEGRKLYEQCGFVPARYEMEYGWNEEEATC